MKKISRREFLTVVAAASAAGLLSACGGSSGGTTSTSAAGGGAASGQSINLRIASSSPTVEVDGDGTTALGISTLYFVNQISAPMAVSPHRYSPTVRLLPPPRSTSAACRTAHSTSAS